MTQHHPVPDSCSCPKPDDAHGMSGWHYYRLGPRRARDWLRRHREERMRKGEIRPNDEPVTDEQVAAMVATYGAYDFAYERCPAWLEAVRQDKLARLREEATKRHKTEIID